MIVYKCNNTKLQGIKISAPADSPNTDGIHVQLSTGVSILSSQIGTGDDCISIGPGTVNTWIESVSCGPGHGIRYIYIYIISSLLTQQIIQPMGVEIILLFSLLSLM